MRTARYLEMMPWLAPERKAHIEGVVQAARGLCMLYGGDLERTELIAVLHDCAKGIEKAVCKGFYALSAYSACAFRSILGKRLFRY